MPFFTLSEIFATVYSLKSRSENCLYSLLEEQTKIMNYHVKKA